MKSFEQDVAIKRENMPDNCDLREVYALIRRVAGDAYASRVILALSEDGDGFDSFSVSDKDDRIQICAPSGVGLAAGFNAYLKERCGYSVGALSTAGSLPPIPPAVGEPIRRKSPFLYRYFFNYCTFSYTYAFDDWADWEKTLDYLLLSGYNLILNPVGLEWVWRETLLAFGYPQDAVRKFLCGPAFYAWQWMMNMTGWAGGAPDWWYEERKTLAGKINARVRAFGASTVTAGYAGMVPADFSERYPDARLMDQGNWCGFQRPALLMPEDPLFDRMASAYYTALKRLDGAEDIHYYSADPFHEGGSTRGIDLTDYSRRVYEKMAEIDAKAVWFFQGWTGSPKPQLLAALPAGRALVTALSARADYQTPPYGGTPWLYSAVFCFGGQYNYQGDAEGILQGPFTCLEREDTRLVGMGYMPEGVNCNEIIYEILARNAFGERVDLDGALSHYLTTRYGVCDEKLLAVWRRLCREVLNGQQLISGESALCARPSLTVKHTSSWSKHPNPFVDQSVLIEYIEEMLARYDKLQDNPAYRKDLTEATRQAISNLSWFFVHTIQKAYGEKDLDTLSEAGAELLTLSDLQEAVVATDRDMLLGKWLEKAKRHGRTPAEKAYFEWNARVQITLWGDREGAAQLHDYAAREWQGLLSDFYRPRWESFLSRLEISLLTDTTLAEIRHYDEELPFVYRKKSYPTTPTGNLFLAVRQALDKLRDCHLSHHAEEQPQDDFETKVAKDLKTKE